MLALTKIVSSASMPSFGWISAARPPGWALRHVCANIVARSTASEDRVVTSIPHLGAVRSSVVLGSFAFGPGVEVAPVLDAYVERGGRVLDLALVYGEGAAERSVGRW